MLQEKTKGDKTVVVVGDDVGKGREVPGDDQGGGGGGTQGERGVEVHELFCVCCRESGSGVRGGEAARRRRRTEARVVVEKDGVAGGEGQSEGVPFIAAPGGAVDEYQRGSGMRAEMCPFDLEFVRGRLVDEGLVEGYHVVLLPRSRSLTTYVPFRHFYGWFMQ